MTHWIETQAGLQMALIITKYLPRITVSLEEIAKKDKCCKECTHWDKEEEYVRISDINKEIAKEWKGK